jgi:hypothetical protein
VRPGPHGPERDRDHSFRQSDGTIVHVSPGAAGGKILSEVKEMTNDIHIRVEAASPLDVATKGTTHEGGETVHTAWVRHPQLVALAVGS